MTLSLAFSPCPNDTYLFYAWVHGQVARDLPVSSTLADIETLNSAAKKETYDVTKLSLGAYPNVWERYQMLPVGTALSKGYGPKIIGLPGNCSGDRQKGKGLDLSQVLGGKRIAVPGEHTTAFLALRVLYGSNFIPIFCPYHQVLQHVKKGLADYGLLIHETRTHFIHEGVDELVDLGEVWQARYGLSLPLGGLFIQRTHSLEKRRQVVQGLRDSLDFARQFPQRTEPYMLEHSQDKDLTVIARHLKLYVTDETMSLTSHANSSLLHFFKCGEERNWWPRNPSDWILDE